MNTSRQSPHVPHPYNLSRVETITTSGWKTRYRSTHKLVLSPLRKSGWSAECDWKRSNSFGELVG